MEIINKAHSYLGKNVWFFRFGALVLEITGLALGVFLAYDFFIRGGIDSRKILIAVLVQLLSILFYVLSRYAARAHELNELGGIEAFLNQPLDLSDGSGFVDIVERCGVSAEFKSWESVQLQPVTIKSFDDGLNQAIAEAYHLPIVAEATFKEVFTLNALAHGSTFMKMMSIVGVIVTAIMLYVLFTDSASNLNQFTYPMVSLIISGIVYAIGLKMKTISRVRILSKPLHTGVIDALMGLSKKLDVHVEFITLMRSDARPKTLIEAQKWLMQHNKNNSSIFNS